MPHTGNARPQFTSEIAPTAWKQIVALPQELHVPLLLRLSTLANLASMGRHPLPASGGTEVETPLSFVVGDFAARYEADLQARVIRLLEVARRQLGDPLETHGNATAGPGSVEQATRLGCE